MHTFHIGRVPKNAPHTWGVKEHNAYIRRVFDNSILMKKVLWHTPYRWHRWLILLVSVISIDSIRKLLHYNIITKQDEHQHYLQDPLFLPPRGIGLGKLINWLCCRRRCDVRSDQDGILRVSNRVIFWLLSLPSVPLYLPLVFNNRYYPGSSPSRWIFGGGRSRCLGKFRSLDRSSNYMNVRSALTKRLSQILLYFVSIKSALFAGTWRNETWRNGWRNETWRNGRWNETWRNGRRNET